MHHVASSFNRGLNNKTRVRDTLRWQNLLINTKPRRTAVDYESVTAREARNSYQASQIRQQAVGYEYTAARQQLGTLHSVHWHNYFVM